jgi:hypothetical protein
VRHIGIVSRAVLSSREDHAVLAATQTKETIAGTGQDNHASPSFPSDFINAVANLMTHFFCEHVAVLWTIHRDGSNGAIFFVKDFVELHV